MQATSHVTVDPQDYKSYLEPRTTKDSSLVSWSFFWCVHVLCVFALFCVWYFLLIVLLVLSICIVMFVFVVSRFCRACHISLLFGVFDTRHGKKMTTLHQYLLNGEINEFQSMASKHSHISRS